MADERPPELEARVQGAAVQADGDGAGHNKSAVENGVITRTKSGKKEAWAKAKEFASATKPVVPSKPGKSEYEKQKGKRFSLTAPSFSTDKPNLADLSVGISLYFSTLSRLSWSFLAMAILCIPTMFITFFAVPSWAEDEQGISALKKFSIGAMAKTSSLDAYGCDEMYCTFPNLSGLRTEPNPLVKCRAQQSKASCTNTTGCTYQDSCGGCVNSGSTCIETQVLLKLIVWMDLICTVAFAFMLAFQVEHVDATVQAIDDNNITPSDFTVIVRGVPADCNPEELGNFFAKYNGSVCPKPALLAWITSTTTKPPAGAPAADAQRATDAQPAASSPSAPVDSPATPAADGGAESRADDTRITVSGKKLGAGEARGEEPVKEGAGGVAGVFIGRRCGRVLRLFQERAVWSRKQILMSIALEKEAAQEKKATPRDVTSAADAEAAADSGATAASGEKEKKEASSIAAAQGQPAAKRSLAAKLREALFPPLATQLAQVEARLEKLEHDITATGKAGTLDAVCAFVLFNSQAAQEDCLRHYQTSTWDGCCGGSLGVKGSTLFGVPMPMLLLRAFQRPELRFTRADGRAFPLHVEKAPEPSNILWENLEVSRVMGFVRLVSSNLLTFVIVIVSFGVIVTAKGYSEMAATSVNVCSNASFVRQCNGAIEWATPVPSLVLHAPLNPCPPAAAACTLGDAWLGRLSPADFSAALNGAVGLATPLDVDVSTKPASTALLTRAPCRFNYTGGGEGKLIPLSQLTAQCKNASSIHEGHWRSLLSASRVLQEPKTYVRSDVDDAYEFRKACTNCFCTNLEKAYPLLWADSWDFSFFKGRIRVAYLDAAGKDTDEEAPCTMQALNTFRFQGLQTAAAVLVVVFNNFMKTSTQMLAKYERHTTLTLEESSTSLALFLSQFVNTGLIALVVYGNLPIASLKRIFYGAIFAGPYPDFTIQWYRVVGAQLTFTMLTSIVNPAIPLISSLVSKCMLPCLPLPLLQEDLNHNMVGPDFVLSVRYGMLLNVLFVCMSYSAGMPALHFLASAFCLFTYLFDKVLLLRVARLPPQYDEALTMQFLRVMPVALLFHFLGGIWMFSAADMWPRPATFGLDEQFAKLQVEAFPCVRQTSELTCAQQGATCLWNAEARVCSINKANDDYVTYTTFDFMPRLFNAVTIVYSVCCLLFLLNLLLRAIPVTRPIMHLLDAALKRLVILLRTALSIAARKVMGGGSRNKVSPEEPLMLKVGDRVFLKERPAQTGGVVAIQEQVAQVKWDATAVEEVQAPEGNSSEIGLFLLQRIPPAGEGSSGDVEAGQEGGEGGGAKKEKKELCDDPLYKEALAQKMFGNAASDYNILKIGEYGSLLSHGDNKEIWEKVAPPDWLAA